METTIVDRNRMILIMMVITVKIWILRDYDDDDKDDKEIEWVIF